MRKKIILSLLLLFSGNQLFADTSISIRPIDFVYGVAILGVAWKMYHIISKLLKIPCAFTIYFARHLDCYQLTLNAIEANQNEALSSLFKIINSSTFGQSERKKLTKKAIEKNNTHALKLIINSWQAWNLGWHYKLLVTACQLQAAEMVSLLCKVPGESKYLTGEMTSVVLNYLENLIETKNPAAEDLYSSLCKPHYRCINSGIKFYNRLIQRMVDNNNIILLKYLLTHKQSYCCDFDPRLKKCFIAACQAQATEIISLLCSIIIPKEGCFPPSQFIIPEDFKTVYDYLKTEAEQNITTIIDSVFNWCEKNNLPYLKFATYIIKEQPTFRALFSKIILQNIQQKTRSSDWQYFKEKKKLLTTMLTTGCQANNQEILFLLNHGLTSELSSLENETIVIIIGYLNGLLKNNNHDLFMHILFLFSDLAHIQLQLWSTALQNNFSQLADIIKTHYKLTLKTQNSKGLTIFHLAVKNSFPESVLQTLINQDYDINKDSYAINTTAHNGATPLHLLTAKDKESSAQNNTLLERLLTHQGIKLNIKDSAGKTPLMYAACSGNENVVNILLNCKAVDLHTKDVSGKTWFHWLFDCTRSRQADAHDNMKIKAMPYFTSMKNQNRQDFLNTELHSILSMKLDIIDINQTSRFIDCCIELGADPNRRDSIKKRSLDVAEEQWRIFKKIPLNTKIFIMQEQLYHLFLRKTPAICDQELRDRLNDTSKLPTEVSNHILKYYHQLNIQYALAIYANKNPDYYQQYQEKRKTIENIILQKIYSKIEGSHQ